MSYHGDMKIVLLADLHYGNMAYEEGEASFSPRDHDEFAMKVHALKPDILVVAGDVADSMFDPGLLDKCLDVYKNPHGDSLMIPGNHDVWCLHNGVDPEAKYKWNLQTAAKYGWVALSDTPFSRDGVIVAGSMGWYDFSTSPKWLGKTAQMYEKRRAWSDYTYMGLKDDPDPMPMMTFCGRRMAEYRQCLSLVPADRKALLVVTHIVGMELLLGPLRDDGTAYFGNTTIGDEAIRAGADYYYCGHTHFRAEAKVGKATCINNGSKYGQDTKVYDVVDF